MVVEHRVGTDPNQPQAPGAHGARPEAETRSRPRGKLHRFDRPPQQLLAAFSRTSASSASTTSPAPKSRHLDRGKQDALPHRLGHRRVRARPHQGADPPQAWPATSPRPASAGRRSPQVARIPRSASKPPHVAAHRLLSAEPFGKLRPGRKRCNLGLLAHEEPGIARDG